MKLWKFCRWSEVAYIIMSESGLLLWCSAGGLGNIEGEVFMVGIIVIILSTLIESFGRPKLGL